MRRAHLDPEATLAEQRAGEIFAKLEGNMDSKTVSAGSFGGGGARQGTLENLCLTKVKNLKP